MTKLASALCALFLIASCHRHGDFFGDGPCDDDKGRGLQPPNRGYPGSGSGGGTGTTTDGGVAVGGNGGPGGASAPASTGYCSSDAVCGTGWVCDRTLGACAQPRGGCGMAGFEPKRTTGEVVLVLDRSNSMRDATPSGSKWTDLVGSLTSVLGRRNEVAWGLTLFPASDARACVTAPLSVSPAVGSAPAIASMVSAATPTGSGTPTREAVRQAGEQMLAAGRPTRKYLLLATDGEPNCAPTAINAMAPDLPGSTQAIRALAEKGVTTFVLGVAAGQEPAAALSAMAQAGGHARQGTTPYYTAGDATALESALDEVARQVALCTFDLTPPPPAGSTLTLSVGGRVFPRAPTHVGDGWDVTAAGRSIELYGAACDAVQAGGAISLTYGCGTGSRCDQAAMACVPDGLP